MLNELDTNRVDKPSSGSKGHLVLIGALGAGLILALAGDGYLVSRSNDLREELAQTKEATQAQISKLSEATTALLDQRMQTLNDEVKNAQGSADTAVKRARMDALKQAKELSQRLEEQQK